MKSINVTVPWQQGLHLRPASKLARTASNFSSQIQVKSSSSVADGKSVLSILLLSASLGSRLSVHASGDDEHEAIRALQTLFSGPAGHEFGLDDGLEIRT